MQSEIIKNTYGFGPFAGKSELLDGAPSPSSPVCFLPTLFFNRQIALRLIFLVSFSYYLTA